MKDTTESSILRKTKSFWSYTVAGVVSQNKLVIQKVNQRNQFMGCETTLNFMMDIYVEIFEKFVNDFKIKLVKLISKRKKSSVS